MKLAIGILAMFLVFEEVGEAQTSCGSSSNTETLAPIREADTESYMVIGAAPSQGAALRAQIRLMHPEVLRLRVFVVPHWKYLDNARIFHLHVLNEQSIPLRPHFAEVARGKEIGTEASLRRKTAWKLHSKCEKQLCTQPRSRMVGNSYLGITADLPVTRSIIRRELSAGLVVAFHR